MSRIENRASFDIIRYANSWEDADVLVQALQPVAGKRMLSIASAGDNAFALLADGAEVVAVDLSAAQLSLVALKTAAIAQLDDDSLLGFLGVSEMHNRLAVYRSLTLDDATRAYWDTSLEAIEHGVIHAGKFENYFRLFRRYVLPLVHTQKEARRMLQERTREERIRYYNERWNTWRWRALFRVFFSRFVMGRAGRDPEFFRYVEGSVAERIFKRAEYAFTELPTHSNPYLTFIFTGNYGATLPRYLRRLDAVRANLGKLSTVHGSIDDAAQGKFDGFYLSDIFEYVDEATFEQMYGRILDAANPKARLAYWNMLVPRRLPKRFAAQVIERRDVADPLFAQDLAFFYSAFVVEEVK